MRQALLTPPQVAERFGVSPDKVRAWIASGELAATNVATRPSGRPRWRISAAALAAFEAARQGERPTPKPRRRRKRQPDVIQFF